VELHIVTPTQHTCGYEGVGETTGEGEAVGGGRRRGMVTLTAGEETG